MPSDNRRGDRHLRGQLNVRVPDDVLRLIAALQQLHQRRFPGISQADVVAMCVREEARKEGLVNAAHRNG